MGDAMRVFILTAVFLVLSVIGIATCSASIAPPLPQYTAGLQSMVFLRMEKGTCTGVVVGKYTILTATHCVEKGGDLKEVDDERIHVMRMVKDKHDHTLVYLRSEITGKRIAQLGRMPGPGSEVYLWGNPSDMRTQLRIGRVAGQLGVELGRKLKMPFYTTTIDINGWHGDSGGAYFDSTGRIVGLVYGSYVVRNIYGSWSLGLAQPIEFSHDQIREIR